MALRFAWQQASYNFLTVIRGSAVSRSSRAVRMLSSAQQPTDPARRPLNRRLEVDYQELSLLQCLEQITLIDVRQPAELISQDQIPGSVHIPVGNLREAFQLSDEGWKDRFGVEKPSKSNGKGIIFYARGPIASSAAVEIAHKLGYKNSRHYVGGWEDYCNQNGLPVMKSKLDAADDDCLKQHYNYHYYNPDLHYL